MTHIRAIAVSAALIVITATPSLGVEVAQSVGKVTFLRVHDVGTKFGSTCDDASDPDCPNSIDVEVVVQLDTKPGEAYGFQLRNDSNRAARQGMLDLLRDAFNNEATVVLDFEIEPGKKNSILFRVALTKP
jgi:hypothetical protein